MLTIHHLSKRYDGGTCALDRIDLAIPQGQVVAIIGGSGCGKSTLLRIVSGLDQATSGQVHIDGALVTAPHPRIGVIFQEPRLLPWLTVGGNVGFGLGGIPAAERRARVDRALERVGLSDKIDVWPRQLSGGQAQRVAIARTLVTVPGVVLLDEPFSALDAFTRREQQRQLLQIWRATPARPTLVIVTHDVDEAILLADRVIVMRPNPGRIAADIQIDLPRPRNTESTAFQSVHHELMETLNRTLPVPVG